MNGLKNLVRSKLIMINILAKSTLVLAMLTLVLAMLTLTSVSSVNVSNPVFTIIVLAGVNMFKKGLCKLAQVSTLT